MMAAVFCVQWLSKSVFLTGVRVYVLLVLGSHVMKEPLLSKMTSLTEQAVEWGIKTMFGLISVSYTHLDVYKRQPINGEEWSGRFTGEC